MATLQGIAGELVEIMATLIEKAVEMESAGALQRAGALLRAYELTGAAWSAVNDAAMIGEEKGGITWHGNGTTGSGMPADGSQTVQKTQKNAENPCSVCD